ncbi:MAG: glycosyltransferase [Deltaproteobacteria bacterium]|nr:glycosyltransferase [Deltaproteobacteria bacterium]
MISALLPVRDGAACLDTALESLYSQQLRPDECVVVDDGSLDATAAILETWSRRWNGLRVVRTPGVGVARALNAGLEHCQGDWIARMDADDRARPERLARQLATARESGATLVGCEVTHWVQGDDSAFRGMRRHIDWANGLHSHDELENALWIDSPLPHPGWLVTKKSYEAVGCYDESGKLPEDYEWLHRFFAAARKSNGLRATKVAGIALLDWAESPTRLTRASDYCTEDAFNTVKARALRGLLAGRTPDIFVFGLGPKGRAMVPKLREVLGPLRAIVDVSVKKTGRDFQGTAVWEIKRWAETPAQDPFVIICLGTPETRQAAVGLCVQHGLAPIQQFIAL